MEDHPNHAHGKFEVRLKAAQFAGELLQTQGAIWAFWIMIPSQGLRFDYAVASWSGYT